MKTKPTQGCVRELQSIGLRPDVLVCRSDYPLTQDIRDKLALFCNVRPDHVLQNLDASILYQVPLMMEDEHLAEVVLGDLGLPQREPDLTQWRQMCDRWMHPKRRVDIALVGKYTKLHDAYLSVAEALRHAGVANDAMWRSTGSTPRPSRRRTSAKFWAICPASSSPAASAAAASTA